MLQEAGHNSVDPCFIWFCDSSFGDCDAAHSTGCPVGLVQGGLINFSSFVPNPIAVSLCEFKGNAMTVAAMVLANRHDFNAILFTVIKTVLSLFPCSPTVCLVWLLLATNSKQRNTSMSCHISRQWYHIQQACQAGHIYLVNIDCNKYH
jgi:hypothetical protein